MIDKESAIEILKQYREKPTLINEINTVEEAVWLDEALEMGIEALEQEPFINKPCVAQPICHEDKIKVLDEIKAEIEEYLSTVDYAISEDELTIKGLKDAYTNCLEIIDEYRSKSEE